MICFKLQVSLFKSFIFPCIWGLSLELYQCIPFWDIGATCPNFLSYLPVVSVIEPDLCWWGNSLFPDATEAEQRTSLNREGCDEGRHWTSTRFICLLVHSPTLLTQLTQKAAREPRVSVSELMIEAKIYFFYFRFTYLFIVSICVYMCATLCT